MIKTTDMTSWLKMYFHQHRETLKICLAGSWESGPVSLFVAEFAIIIAGFEIIIANSAMMKWTRGKTSHCAKR